MKKRPPNGLGGSVYSTNFKLEEARRFGLEMTRPLITWWK